MPASLGTEEKLLELILKEKEWAAKKVWLGLSALKPSELKKETTAKVFGENELKAAEGWTRVEIGGIEWEVEKELGETGGTKFKNKNAVTGFGKVTGAEEKTLETFAVLAKKLASEDEASSAGILVFGKLTTKITVNKTSTVEFAAKQLIIECE
jgi:hypothetical protein